MHLDQSVPISVPKNLTLHSQSMCQLLLKTALAHHYEGHLCEAEELYRQVLKINPSQPQALSMLGMVLMDMHRNVEAETLFLQHLDGHPDDALTLQSLGKLLQNEGYHSEAINLFKRAVRSQHNFAPIFNDMAVSLHRLGQFEAALLALDQATALDPHFVAAHDNRGVVLYDCRRFDEAAMAHRLALALLTEEALPKQTSVLIHLARASYESSDFATAEVACRSILNNDSHHPDALEQLAKIMYRLKRDVDAVDLLNLLARTQGLGIKDRPEHPEATILVLGGVGASHLPTRYILDSTRFTNMTLVMLSPEQSDAPLGSVSYDDLADADLIFNTLGEVEKENGQFNAVKALSARLNVPLINHPELVARTGRDHAQKLFGNIAGLIVPNVRRMSRNEKLDHLFFEYPFLIRPLGSHGGDDLALIQTTSELSKYFAMVPYEHFLSASFYDFKWKDGCYRKYRFIFVDRQPYPYHLAIANKWLVHYWRADMSTTDKRQEEESFLCNWRDVFGKKACKVIEQIGLCMNLDYGGLDCSLLPNGEVLFFEANACMLVHLDDDEVHLTYKQQAVFNIRDAVSTMLKNRIIQN